MRSKIFKTALIALMALIAISDSGFAQDTKLNDSASTAQISTDITVGPVNVGLNQVKVKLHKLKAGLKNLNTSTNAQVTVALNNLTTELNADIKDIAPQINLAFKEGADVNTNSSDNSDADDVNLVKNYSKTYSVDGNDALSISNKYGKVIVNTWARSEVKVDVQIKVGAGSQDAAQKLLDNVTINDSKNGNSVSFSTAIGEAKNSWFSVFSGDGNHHIEINYTVYMPAKNDLVIDNRYGAIVIPDMDGKITINSAYGSFKGGALSKQSDIRVKYGNADIESINTCAIDVGYGNLNVGSANKIDANINYSGIKIGRLHEFGAINIKYGGGVDINNVDKSVRSLAINASYTNVNLGLSNDENASFSVVTHYGDFNYDGHDVTITEKTPDDDGRPHFTKSYKGYLGKNGSEKDNGYNNLTLFKGNTIAVNASYGNVRFQ